LYHYDLVDSLAASNQEGSMGRFLAGVASALLLMTAGLFIWRSQADAVQLVPPAPGEADAAMSLLDVSGPPEASEKTREQKRFSRYDKDKNGGVSRDEYLMARRKGFAKMDVNGDGKLGFEEYAIKTSTKFAGADRDRTGVLTPAEFLTTKVIRKSQQAKCPPPIRFQKEDGDGEET
jgi:EF hand